MIAVFSSISSIDPVTDPHAKAMLERACPECGSPSTYLTEADVSGETCRVVICDGCGHAEIADRTEGHS